MRLNQKGLIEGLLSAGLLTAVLTASPSLEACYYNASPCGTLDWSEPVVGPPLWVTGPAVNVSCEDDVHQSKSASDRALYCENPVPPTPMVFQIEDACPRRGSVVYAEQQIIGERVPIVGTDFYLAYMSHRVDGYKARSAIRSTVFGSASPSSNVTGGNVSIQIAGQTNDQSFAPSTGVINVHTWNGLDASGQPVKGSVRGQVSLSYTYSSLPEGYRVYGRGMAYYLPLGGFNAISAGLGGWTLSVHHYYDSVRKIIELGDGRRLTVSATPISGGYRIPNSDGSEVYFFDNDGLHLETKYGLTGATKYRFAYSSGRMTSVTDAFGNQTVITASGGKPVSITAPKGQVTTLGVDSNGYLSSIQSPAGQVYQMTYGSGGLLATFKSPSGAISTFSYDSLGNLVRDSSSAGPSLSLARTWADDNSYTITMASGENRVTSIGVRQSDFIDPDFKMTQRLETSPSGAVTNTYYAPFSSSSFSYSSGSNGSSSYSSDPRFGTGAAFPSSTTIRSAFGKTLTTTVSRTASLANAEDPFSVTTLTETQSQNAITPPWTTTYTASTKQMTTTSPAGRVTKLKIDAQERPVSLQLASYTPLTFAYDSSGRLVSFTQGVRVTTHTYNTAGFLSSIKNPLNQVTSFTYDLNGQVLTQTLPDSRIIKFTYDANGNLASLTPPTSATHSFLTNLMDLFGAYVAPSLGSGTLTTAYAYNKDRQLIKVTRPSGAIINLSYGTTSGLLDSMSDGSKTFTYMYQSGDRLLTATSPDNIATSFTYDGDLITRVDYSSGGKGSIVFDYNNLFQLASAQIGTGTAYLFGYDKDGLLTKTGNETITRAATTGYVSRTTLGSSTETYTYSSTFGELASYQAKYGTTNHLLLTYTRDNLGRIFTRKETVGAGVAAQYTYTYDAAGRLKLVAKDGVTQATYAYNGNSNRVSVTRNGVTTSATYDAQDRLKKYGTLSYTYNLNGERTSKVDSSNSQTTNYAYDSWGNLKQVKLSSGKAINYLYDSQHRRAARLVGTTVNAYYVYLDQTRIAGVLNSSGGTTMTFLWGHKPNVPEYMIKGGVTYKFIVDHVGSVRRVLKNSDGTIAQEITYDEFGRVLSDTKPGFQPFGFAGGLYDPDTKLVHFGARDYDPETGRWLSKDPILFAGGDTNLYGYVMNDPVNWIDTDGTRRIHPVTGWPIELPDPSTCSRLESCREIAEAIDAFGDRVPIPFNALTWACSVGMNIACSPKQPDKNGIPCDESTPK